MNIFCTINITDPVTNKELISFDANVKQLPQIKQKEDELYHSGQKYKHIYAGKRIIESLIFEFPLKEHQVLNFFSDRIQMTLPFLVKFNLTLQYDTQRWELFNCFPTAFHNDPNYGLAEVQIMCDRLNYSEEVPWTPPEKWIIHNPIIKESFSPAELVLDRFLAQTSSK